MPELKRPYKKLPDSELHQIEDDQDENPGNRAFAKAELFYRLRFWPKIVAIATVVTALVAVGTCTSKVIFKCSQMPIESPNGKNSNQGRNASSLIEPKNNTLHK